MMCPFHTKCPSQASDSAIFHFANVRAPGGLRSASLPLMALAAGLPEKWTGKGELWQEKSKRCCWNRFPVIHSEKHEQLIVMLSCCPHHPSSSSSSSSSFSFLLLLHLNGSPRRTPSAYVSTMPTAGLQPSPGLWAFRVKMAGCWDWRPSSARCHQSISPTFLAPQKR